jgi:hypothetical protein
MTIVQTMPPRHDGRICKPAADQRATTYRRPLSAATRHR